MSNRTVHQRFPFQPACYGEELRTSICSIRDSDNSWQKLLLVYGTIYHRRRLIGYRSLMIGLMSRCVG